MSMKKQFVVLIAFLAAAFMLFGNAMAEEEPAFLVSTGRASCGEEVALTVSTANNPGIASFALTVGYDRNALEWVGVEKGDLDGMWDVPVGTELVWISADNFTEDDVLLTLVFRVKDDAPSGLAEVNVSYEPDNVFNENEENVYFDIIPGGVEIENGRSELSEGPEASPLPRTEREEKAPPPEESIDTAEQTPKGAQTDKAEEADRAAVPEDRGAAVESTEDSAGGDGIAEKLDSSVPVPVEAHHEAIFFVAAGIVAGAVILLLILIRKRNKRQS